MKKIPRKVIRLTPEQVLAIHDQMIKRFGGSHGVRDVGLIESAVVRPQATFDGVDLYTSIFEKAAALLHSILKTTHSLMGTSVLPLLPQVSY